MDATGRTLQPVEKTYRHRAAFAAALACIAAAVVIAGFLRNFHVLGLKTVPGAPSALHDERRLHGLVVRRESVVTAPAEGVFTPLVQEETRVRTGQPVGMLVTATGQTPVTAPMPGIVRYHWDGWETTATMESLWTRTPADWLRVREGAAERWDLGPHRTPTGSSVQRGDGLVRLVDSHGVMLYVDMPAGAGWRSGQTVQLSVPDVSGEPLRARVVQTGRIAGSDEGAALLELQMYLPVLDAVRHLDVHVVLSSHVGTVVPVDALVWSDGEPGVLVQRRTTVQFVPVVVLAQVGDEVVLDGVAPEDRIVVNPWRVPGW